MFFNAFKQDAASSWEFPFGVGIRKADRISLMFKFIKFQYFPNIWSLTFEKKVKKGKKVKKYLNLPLQMRTYTFLGL